MQYILSLDQGTTSSRAIIFDREGNIISQAQKEFEQIFPRPGWVEHDPEEIWLTQKEVMSEAIRAASLQTKDIAACGITNQRETTIVWEKSTGKPIYNAIVWQDRRTAKLCEALKDKESLIQKKTGLLLDPYFSGTKVSWILENVSGAKESAQRGELLFGTVDTWLLYKLNGLHLTDITNASRTLLFNIHSGEWDEELLSLLGIPRVMLPEVRSSSEVYGKTKDGIPLAGIAGDQQAATMGQACLSPGMAKNTYGTGCFLVMNTGEKPQLSENRLLATVAWQRAGQTTYALEGSIFVGGAIVQWLRDGLGIIKHSSDIERLANSVTDNGGLYFVPALTGLGAPQWDSYARGTIIGITRGTAQGHIARAALEGIAFQVADLVSAMEADAEKRVSELRVDGGAAANDLLMQLQADILQVPVVRPTILETTALGAAYLAGLAVGFWKSEDEIVTNWKIDKTFEPSIPEKQAEDLRGRWSEAVKRSLAWEKRDE